jgi:hypothetical protein
MELKMTASKLSKLIAILCGSAYMPIALAHPGHQHSQGIAERLLHAVQTEWLAPLLLLIAVLIAGYLSVKKAGKT